MRGQSIILQRRPVVLIEVRDWNAATLTVQGISVLERNLRHLEELGFTPYLTTTPRLPALLKRVATVTPEKRAALGDALCLRGDVQYSDDFFKSVPTECTLPQQTALDVADLLKNHRPAVVIKQLSDALFAEIFSKTNGWVARSLNKKISFRLTHLLVRTNITPNQITAFNFIMGVLGCLFLISSQWMVRVLGACIIQFNSILDGCDGEVARLKVCRSRFGAWFDTISDDVLNNIMFVCIYIGLYRQTHSEVFLKACIATTLASLGVSFFIYHYLIKHDTQNAAHFRLSWENKSELKPGTPAKAGWFDAIKPILKRDFFIFVVMILVFLDFRMTLTLLFAPIWVAFFLYLASFLYGICKPKTLLANS